MNKKIKSITEAFSMQPRTMTVESPNPFTISCIDIRLESKDIRVNGELGEYHVYRGYDENGKVMFEFLANAVNVFYDV
jgi:hypothetical protein